MNLNFLLKGILPFAMIALFSIPNVSLAQDGDHSASERTTVVKICGYNSNLEGAVPGCLDNAVPIHVTGNECTAPAPVRVYVTNVVRRPELGVVYTLTGGAPDIYLEHQYDVGNMQITGPYDEAMYIGKDDNGSDIFAIIAELETYRSSEVGCVPDFQEIVDFNIVVNIMEKVGTNQYDLYPIHDYSSREDLFSCEVFMETACDCLPNPPLSCAAIQPEYDLKACMNCDCTDGTSSGNQGDDIRGLNNDGSYEIFNPLNEVTISPNPAKDFININCSFENAQELNLSILDIQGKLVYSSKRYAETGQNNLELNTEQLDSGIYYLEIKAGKLSQTKKLIIID